MQVKMESFNANINLEVFLEEAIKQEGMYEVTANLLNVFASIYKNEGYNKKDAKEIIKHLHKVCDVVE